MKIFLTPRTMRGVALYSLSYHRPRVLLQDQALTQIFHAVIEYLRAIGVD